MAPEERRYRLSAETEYSVNDRSAVDNTPDGGVYDIDDLNVDISNAALKLLQRRADEQRKQIINSKLYSPANVTPEQHSHLQLTTSSPVPTRCAFDGDYSIFHRLNAAAVLRGLSARPPCRFEVFRQYVKSASPSLAINSVICSTSNAVDLAKASALTVKNGDQEDKEGGGDQVEEVDVVLDIAHNKDAMVALVRKLGQLYPEQPLRCGIIILCHDLLNCRSHRCPSQISTVNLFERP